MSRHRDSIISALSRGDKRSILETAAGTEKTVEKTLYRILLMGGTWLTIDESPYDLKGDWADVRTYSIFSTPEEGTRYFKSYICNIRPSMIVGFKMLEDCEVVE